MGEKGKPCYDINTDQRYIFTEACASHSCPNKAAFDPTVIAKYISKQIANFQCISPTGKCRDLQICGSVATLCHCGTVSLWHWSVMPSPPSLTKFTFKAGYALGQGIPHQAK